MTRGVIVGENQGRRLFLKRLFQHLSRVNHGLIGDSLLNGLKLDDLILGIEVDDAELFVLFPAHRHADKIKKLGCACDLRLLLRLLHQIECGEFLDELDDDRGFLPHAADSLQIADLRIHDCPEGTELPEKGFCLGLDVSSRNGAGEKKFHRLIFVESGHPRRQEFLSQPFPVFPVVLFPSIGIHDAPLWTVKRM